MTSHGLPPDAVSTAGVDPLLTVTNVRNTARYLALRTCNSQARGVSAVRDFIRQVLVFIHIAPAPSCLL
jgi:hypothetical protein